MKNEIKAIETALKIIKEKEKIRNDKIKCEIYDIYNICNFYYKSSKLNTDLSKKKFIDENGFDSIDHLNEWIRMTERNFVYLIAQLKNDML